MNPPLYPCPVMEKTSCHHFLLPISPKLNQNKQNVSQSFRRLSARMNGKILKRERAYFMIDKMIMYMVYVCYTRMLCFLEYIANLFSPPSKNFGNSFCVLIRKL